MNKVITFVNAVLFLLIALVGGVESSILSNPVNFFTVLQQPTAVTWVMQIAAGFAPVALIISVSSFGWFLWATLSPFKYVKRMARRTEQHDMPNIEQPEQPDLTKQPEPEHTGTVITVETPVVSAQKQEA